MDPSPPSERNLGLWFRGVVERYGEREALRRRTSKEVAPLTYAELGDLVRRAAAGFAALGVKPGDRVGLVSDNRREWLVVDLALGAQGAVDVPRGGDSSNVEIVAILAHSGSRGAVVEDLDRARALVEGAAKVPGLEFLVLLSGEPARLERRSSLRVLGYDDLLELGSERLSGGRDDLATRAPAVEGDALLTLVYTSGTTGAPKGVQLSHRNVLSNVAGMRGLLPVEPGDAALSILPTWHMFERAVEYVVLDRGGCLVYTDARRVRADLASERPRLMATVPRVWEGLHDAIDDRVAKAPRSRRALFRAAVATAVGHVRARAAGRPLRAAALALPAWLARRAVFDRLRRAAGLDRLRVAVSGGGSLPLRLDEFFVAAGVPLINGYGLTETSPIVTVRRVDRNRPGTVGSPIPHTEIRAVGADGEPVSRGEVGVLQVRGPQVFSGYYRDEDLTRKAFPGGDGWFDTGDLVRIDDAGEVSIVGRAKDTIVLRGGENVEPERVESALRASPYVVQAILVGQDAKSVAALVAPNVERLAADGVGDLGTGEFIDAEPARAKIRSEIDRLVSSGAGFRSYERPSRFRLLRRPLDPASGLLTATLKLKRRAIAERYRAAIDKLLQP